MSKPTIEEQIEAVKNLRHAATGRLEACRSVQEAVRILDSADLFADLDDKRNDREATDQVGLPTLAPGEAIRPAFSDTHPRAARELGEVIADEQP